MFFYAVGRKRAPHFPGLLQPVRSPLHGGNCPFLLRLSLGRVTRLQGTFAVEDTV